MLPIFPIGRRFPWLGQLFYRQAFQFTPRWQPTLISSFRSQWRYFAWQWPGHLVLIQLGGRFYAFNQGGLQLGYRLDNPSRTGFDASASVLFQDLHQRLLPCLRKQYIAYCLILEEGYLKGG